MIQGGSEGGAVSGLGVLVLLMNLGIDCNWSQLQQSDHLKIKEDSDWSSKCRPSRLVIVPSGVSSP